MEWSVLVQIEEGTWNTFLLAYLHDLSEKKEVMWAPSKMAAAYKPGREPSLNTDHTLSLTSDFQPPELWEDKCLFFKYAFCFLVS